MRTDSSMSGQEENVHSAQLDVMRSALFPTRTQVTQWIISLVWTQLGWSRSSKRLLLFPLLGNHNCVCLCVCTHLHKPELVWHTIMKVEHVLCLFFYCGERGQTLTSLTYVLCSACFWGITFRSVCKVKVLLSCQILSLKG